MRTRLFIVTVLAVMSGTFLQAQLGLEIGIKGGGSAYSGDLSPDEFGLYAEDFKLAGGAYLRYRPTNRFGFRVNGNFGSLTGSRETSLLSGVPSEPGQPEIRVTVPRNFRSQIAEFNAVLEYDLIKLGDYDYNFTAFYLYGGVGVLSFNPQRREDGELIDLQPLRTEAQGLDPTNPEYASAPYSLTEIVGVIGAGIRTRAAGRITLGIEMGMRVTGTDYLDDVGSTNVRYIDVISGPGGSQAGRISNPAVTNPNEIDPNFTYRRGGPFNDYYFIGSLTLGITLGEGGSRKNGCYQF